MAEIGTKKAFAAAAAALQAEADGAGASREAVHTFEGNPGTMVAYPGKPDELTYTVRGISAQNQQDAVAAAATQLSKELTVKAGFPISVLMRSVTQPSIEFLATKEMANEYLKERTAVVRRQLFWGAVAGLAAVGLYLYGAKSK